MSHIYLECINDDIKEPFNLRGVRVKKHEVGGPRLLQHGPDQLGRDGYPVPVFLVTLAVEEKGGDHHNVGGGCESEILKIPNTVIV